MVNMDFMQNIILAEPSTMALLALGYFMLIIAVVVVLAVILVFFLTRRAKKAEPQAPQPPLHSTIKICPKCSAPMPPDSPEGLCPRCLIALNLATQTEIPGEPGAAKPPPAPPLPVADVAKLFPQLEILECLGRGGMGAVYEARQPRLDRIVALKILSPEKQGNQKFAERFEREARALAKLHHPNIVTVYDFGEADGNFYLLMEFVDGLTLRQLLQTRKLSPPEALAIVPKICEALQYAHEQGIVHRDIKPENILMDKEGRIKIADFGIAKILGDGDGANLTAEQVIGTPHYMSPEQIERPQTVDHRADIYSLGVVFYEMLTGELPLGKFQPPSKKVQIDVRLDEIVLRALEKEPERRYQQASEVKTQVETVANSQGSSTGNVSLRGREYRSEQSIFGWPLIHIAWGIDPATQRPREANGLIAIGSRAKGLMAVGLKAKGLFAVGLEAYGLGAAGLIAGGGIAAGLVAFGISSVGLVAYGITSVGLLAIALLRAVGLVSLANHPIGPVHFAIDAPVFLWLGVPIFAVWIVRLIWSAMRAPGPPASSRRTVSSFVIPAVAILLFIALAIFFESRSPHLSQPGSATLSEADFLQKFDSGQIAHATITRNPTLGGAATITGKYYEADKDGKLVLENGRPVEEPFVTPDAVLTPGMENKLLASPNIDTSIPNPIQTGIGYQFFFVLVAVLFPLGILFLLGAIIFLIWRSLKNDTKRGPPLPSQKTDHFWRWFAVVVLSLFAIPFLIAIVGIIAAIAIPNFVKARERAQAVRQRAIAMDEQQIASQSFYIGQASFPYGDSIEITSVEQAGRKMTVAGHYHLASRDAASINLYITSTNSDSRQNPEQSMEISKGDGDFQLTDTHVVPGLPHVSMYADGRLFASIYFGTKEEAAEESQAKWITIYPAASAEAAPPATNPNAPLPAISPGIRINPATGLPENSTNSSATGLPNLTDALQKAQDLMNQGQYEDSLQAITNYFELSRFDPSQAGSRLFAINDWIELGRRYPKAKQALLELRDTDTQKLLDGEGDFVLFGEVKVINQNLLGNDEACYTLFKAIERRDAHLAGQCYLFVEDQLVAKGEYQTCRKYMGDPEFRLENACNTYHIEVENQARMEKIRQRTMQQIQENDRQHGWTNVPAFTPLDNSKMLEKMTRDRFVGQVRGLIEILVGTRDKADAEKIQRESLAVLDDPRLESAMDDAEENIKNHK
jgi:type II secretory pathway pseudopilin PulG